jgi:hypothetical protein
MTMRRLVGTLLTAALLASGSTLAVASPSWAQKRNPCMDQAHWMSQMAWYEAWTQTYYEMWLSFANAQLSPLSGDYIVVVMGTVIHQTDAEVQQGLNTQLANLTAAAAAQADFADNVSAC